MTLYEFTLIADREKVNLLYEQGVYIGKIKRGAKTKVLFQFESFYVEIFYKEYRRFITHIHCFISTDQLAPYLSQVNVEDLMRCMN